MQPIIDAKDLVHEYSRRDEEGNVTGINRALDGVSLQVKEGDFIAVLGANGSGKSTFAKHLNALLTPTEGTLYVGGMECGDHTKDLDIRKTVGMVFQNPDNQFIGSTVQDDIAFSLENVAMPYDQMKVLVEEYSKKVGMYEYLSREPSSLSGGQKQRVAIAGTLVRHPEILVLDEATSMLDPQGRNDIRTLIRNMKKENPDLTIISITHDIEEAYQSDHVIVINKGKVVKEGTPDDVFSDEVLMKKIDLTIPFYKQLKNELEKYGIDINGVDNIDELVDRLCR